jgi:hypothetical protein
VGDVRVVDVTDEDDEQPVYRLEVEDDERGRQELVLTGRQLVELVAARELYGPELGG